MKNTEKIYNVPPTEQREFTDVRKQLFNKQVEEESDVWQHSRTDTKYMLARIAVEKEKLAIAKRKREASIWNPHVIEDTTESSVDRYRREEAEKAKRKQEEFREWYASNRKERHSE